MLVGRSVEFWSMGEAWWGWGAECDLDWPDECISDGNVQG